MIGWPYAWILWVAAECQVTFRRSCDCEFMVDGKCAYTLMLPVGTSGSCSGDSGDTESLRQSMSLIKRNVSDLRDWLSEQSRLLAQAQSGVISLQQSVALLSPAHCNGTSTNLADLIRDHDSQIIALQAAVARVHDLATGVAAVVDRLQETTTELGTQLATYARIEATISNATERADRLATDMRQLKERTGYVCRKRGLLVDGNIRNISADDITVSSSYNINHGSNKVRIQTTGNEGAWCPDEPNDNEWLQFDFTDERIIYGVVTRGRADYEQWVTSYKMAYSSDESDLRTWITFRDVIGDEMIFTGNPDQNSLQVNTLWQPINARFVRLMPLSAYKNSNLCMRADVIGCVGD